MKFRSLLITVLVALMVIMPAATSAQDMDTCFNLSAEDCAEIDAATLNLAVFAMSSESFSIEYGLEVSAEGLPEEMAGATSAYFESSGAIDVVIGGETEIPVTVGAIFDSAYGMGETEMAMPIEVRLVEDYLYFLNPMTGTWQGINLVAAMEDPEFSGQLDSIMGGGEDSPMGAMPDVESLMALSTLLDLPGFIDYTRDGDDFIFTMDLTALGQLAEPEHAEKLAALTTILNDASAGSGDQLASFVQMIPMMLQEGTIVITQSINTELEIVDYMSFEIAATVDAGMLLGDPEAEPIVAYVGFEMEITNVNAAPAAVAPDEWEEIDPSEAMGGM